MQMQDRVGQQFGNYRLIRLIGKGGFAEVYLAENILLKNLRYAIKVMTGASLSKDKQEEFLYEARTIANLQHLNTHIVQIYDVGIQPGPYASESGIPYLVMEFAPQGTLRALYPHNTRVPIERIAFYTKQVAEALQCAHDQTPSIVHRDVKPENMLLRTVEHVLLSDFGIAMTGKTGLLEIPAKKEKLFGTAAYIAPERFAGQTRRASDQYSLAIVVYEWLSGSLPFDGSDQEICFKHMTAEPPPLYSMHPEVTPQIEAVIMRALKKKPEERYQSILEFAQALEKAIQSALREKRWVQQPADTIGRSQKFLPEPPTIHEELPGRQVEVTAVREELPRAPLEDPTVHEKLAKGRGDRSPVQEALPSAPLEAIIKHEDIKHEDRATIQANLPVVRAELWPFQPDRLLGAYLYHNDLDITEPDVHRLTQSDRSVEKFGTARVTRPLQGVREFFDFAPQFSTTYQFSFFRTYGIVLNAASAIIASLLLRSVSVLFVGSLFSGLMFWLCVRAVNPILAMFFGTLLALYWGGAGWVIGNSIGSFLHLNSFPLAILPGLIFFGVSFGSHLRYVRKRNL